MYCQECGKEYGDTNKFCPFCGKVSPAPEAKGPGEGEGGGQAQMPKSRPVPTVEALRGERKTYVALAIIPYVVGVTLLFTLKPPLNGSMMLVALVLIAYATGRFGRFLQFEGREWLIAILLVLLLYLGSFAYMLYKSSRLEGRLKDEAGWEPPAEAPEEKAVPVEVGRYEEALGKWRSWLPVAVIAVFAIIGVVVLAVSLTGHKKAGVARKTEKKAPATVPSTPAVRQVPWLRGVYAADPGHVWAVGDNGIILFFNGTGWSRQPSGTNVSLNSVSGADAGHVWAVGQGRSILFFNGSAWNAQQPPPGNPSGSLIDVDALDASHVWAVGINGEILFCSGSSWSAQNSGSAESLRGVSAADAGHVWAVGFKGTILFYNGSSWAANPQSGTAEIFDLNAVNALDASHAWLVGSMGTIDFYNGGKWVRQSNISDEYDLYGIDAIDAGHAWAVGHRGAVMFFDGSSWKVQDFGTSWTLAGIDALDSSHIWAVGQNGTVMFFDGSRWSEQDAGVRTGSQPSR